MQTQILRGPDIENQYQNLSYFDRGGMGEVYTAQDVHNSQVVALKIIRLTGGENRNLLEQEFKMARNLSHENIIETYYHGDFSNATGSYFYSVTEFCSLGNFRKVITNAQKPLPIQDCLSYFYDLLKGLREAHKLIVHRDLKPENILVATNGKLKICDFGIAKYVDHMTRTNTFKGSGTYWYMSPECWTNDANTVQMDIYSLGIIFFEILTGKVPFTGSSEREIKEHHLFSNLPLLSIFRNDVPISISEIIRKMTNKRPGERYKNVSEIIVALDSVTEPTTAGSAKFKSLLESAHRKINSIVEEKLKQQKEHDELLERKKALNFDIDQLFNQFISVAEKINNSLADQNIEYKILRAPGNNPVANTFKLYFLGKSLTISFYTLDVISNYIRGAKKKIADEYIKNYGRYIHGLHLMHLEMDNAYFLGKVELDATKDHKFGFNLLLRKEPHETYGEWWICKFEYRIQSQDVKSNQYFAFDPQEFFNFYELGRDNVMFNYRMTSNKLSDDDVVDLIDKMTV